MQPKRDKLASIAFELSKDVNKPNYVTVRPHSKGTYYMMELAWKLLIICVHLLSRIYFSVE